MATKRRLFNAFNASDSGVPSTASTRVMRKEKMIRAYLGEGGGCGIGTQMGGSLSPA
jgi:hypothetical protein